MSWEKLEADHTTDVPTGNPTLEDLGIKLTPLEDGAQVTLDNYKRHGYYNDFLGELPQPDPIKQHPLL